MAGVTAAIGIASVSCAQLGLLSIMLSIGLKNTPSIGLNFAIEISGLKSSMERRTAFTCFIGISKENRTAISSGRAKEREVSPAAFRVALKGGAVLVQPRAS